VQYFYPSYSLYPVLADIHGALKNPVKLKSDFGIPEELKKNWIFDAALSFITTPNAPSGRGYSVKELEQFCEINRGVVILMKLMWILQRKMPYRLPSNIRM
jgi:histidinol-phosphate aminotransferase